MILAYTGRGYSMITGQIKSRELSLAGVKEMWLKEKSCWKHKNNSACLWWRGPRGKYEKGRGQPRRTEMNSSPTDCKEVGGLTPTPARNRLWSATQMSLYVGPSSEPPSGWHLAFGRGDPQRTSQGHLKWWPTELQENKWVIFIR